MDVSQTPYFSLIDGIIRQERLSLPMRRLYFMLLCGLVAVPTAVAAAHATGDGVLELRGVNGTAVITGSRGTLWGQMDKGSLRVTDPVLIDGPILVSGYEQKHPGLNEHVTVYTGNDIHFRVTSGRYRLSFKGTGIDLTAVGVGTADLTGDVLADDTGEYALDDGKWLPVPWLERSVSFGVQPVTAGGPASGP